MRALAATLIALAGCTASTLPALPEVVIVADTDLPVPLAASRLRVDLYGEDGAWLESADFARPDPRDWPVSFSVYGDESARARRVWVRLRAYPDGFTRAYEGERPNTWGGPIVTPPPADGPRLVKDGADVTPAIEPDPLVTVELLALVELTPASKRRARLVLRGACLGTSALLGGAGGPVIDSAETCVDTAKKRAPVVITETEDASAPIGDSVQGTWLAEDPCPPADASAPRVCIPGGAAIVGAGDATSAVLVSTLPMRTFGVRRFFIDRAEVSVGRYRDAIARGLTAPFEPVANDASLKATPTGFCTWSTAPMGREDYALSCVAWKSARAFCQFEGGDLPTEVQWEHAATTAGRAAKTRYPWGNDPPDCDRAAYGREPSGAFMGPCQAKGKLPPPPSDSAADVSVQGVIGLAGGLYEWTLDETRAYDDACWGGAAIVDPRCGSTASNTKRTLRGGSFFADMTYMTARVPWKQGDLVGAVGFRCVYPEAAP